MESGKLTVSEERTIDIADYEKIKLYECVSIPIMKFKRDSDGGVTMHALNFDSELSEKEISSAIKNTRIYSRELITSSLDEQEHTLREWAKQFQDLELIKKSPKITPRD